MANEIQIALSVRCSKNGAEIARNISKTADMSGNQMLQAVQTIGTSTEALSIGDTASGYIMVRNLDATNYVELSIDSGNTNKFAKLSPGSSAGTGDFAIFKAAASTTYYATANTAACDVEIISLDA